jgi:2-(1,2-epoxy-1,2-dihydrophenyl)acetyl-CoA isomerase
MSTYETILIERTGHVALVTLNRPASLNAFDTKQRQEFIRAAREVNADEAIRVVVLTGSGRAFSAGADLTESAGRSENRGQDTEDLLNSDYKPGILAISNAPKPWISAVNGAAAGVGSAFAMACDLTVMAEDAYIYQAFGAIGLVPDGGATWQLVRTVGRKKAYEVMVTGEKISAQKCEVLGLCNRVVPSAELVEQALAWAGEIANKAPLAMRYAKESVQFAVEQPLPDVISNEARLQHLCVNSDDSREGAMAFLEKRTPQFKGH